MNATAIVTGIARSTLRVRWARALMFPRERVVFASSVLRGVGISEAAVLATSEADMTASRDQERRRVRGAFR